jgi:hypothetical protein
MRAKPEALPALPKPKGKPPKAREFSDADVESFQKQNGLWLL